jgi:rSAM/selenodomain-associated transferase 2
MTSTARKTSPISIIIPTRNEAPTIAATMERAAHGEVLEVLVVDCGSSDGTADIARRHGARVIPSAPGRGRQMNLGADQARGEILLFLHGDTLLPPDFAPQLQSLLQQPDVVAGAFSLAIDLPGAKVRLVERVANLRSSFLQLPYGDQGIFLYRRKFFEAGGYQEEPILEDVLLIKRLKRLGRIAIAPSAVLTSGRRWQRLGVLRTTLINQAIMLGHLVGIPPQRLKRWYGIFQKI